MIIQQKITGQHLIKKAIIYVRQSSLKQVRENQESQRYQIALTKKASDLGWSDENILIVDTDLGKSGSTTQGRKGFEEIVSEISLSRVGIIFGYEVSRLARNCADWYKLIELCSIFGTLIGDVDGVYNPNYYNDRLLLGLKGTMSEAELHILKNRLETGRMNKVKRGDLVQHLPTGYIRDKHLGVIKDPDQQVQKTLELIFSKFEELGSSQKVLKYLIDNKILTPKRIIFEDEVTWRVPTGRGLLDIFHNPVYAGAFAYGKTQTINGKLKNRTRQPMENWINIVQDKYPKYISWGQYLLNRKKLRENLNNFQLTDTKGIERKGRALLQSIIYCGECGSRLNVFYKNEFKYFCNAMPRTYGEKKCLSVSGHTVDKAVEGVFLKAIEPAQLDLLDEFIEKEKKDSEKIFEHWQQKITRAEYEEKIAQKRYKKVDPENRLVAGKLEEEWEQKLKEYLNLKQDFGNFKIQKKTFSLPENLIEDLQSLSENLPGLWTSGRLENAHKKKLIRTIIDKVVVRKLSAGEIEIKVIWISGDYSVMKFLHPVIKTELMKDYQEIEKLITEKFYDGFSDKQIANELNQRGYKSPRLKPWSVAMLETFRQSKKLLFPKFRRSKLKSNFPGSLTTTEVSQLLNIKENWIHNKIESNRINPQKDKETGLYALLPEHIEILKQELNILDKKEYHHV